MDKKSIIYAWLAILTTCTIGTCGYTLYLNKQMHRNRLYQTTVLHQALEQISQHQTQFEETWQQELTQIQQTNSTLQTHLTALQQNIKIAATPPAELDHHWLLLKARFSIELAELNAYWSDDRNATRDLLKQADVFLTQNDNAALIPIRQALAQAIMALETAPKLDITGLLSQLDALQQQITAHPFKQEYPQTMPTTSPTLENNLSNASWHTRFIHGIHILKQFFIVRYHPDPLQPRLPPAYNALQREIIRLNLQEAQWAVLTHQNDVYQLALKQAISNSERAFGKNNPDIAPILAALTHLQSNDVQIARVIPEASLSPLIEAINTIIHQPDATPSPASSTESTS